MNGARGETRGRVLVVDDDPVILRLVQTLLLRHGFEVARHNDAETGIRHARETGPDVILLDIDMPGLDGIEACRRVRQEARLAHTAVMFFSAGAKDRFIEEGFRAGANDYLEKPFTETELIARVANLTRMARDGEALRTTAEELRARNEVLSRELEAARRMQWALLPSVLSTHPSLNAAVFYEPMVGVGGDLYDLHTGADGLVRFLIADVSGHGVFAALLAAFFKMGYQVYSHRDGGPAAVLQSVHFEICRALDTADFVTAFAGTLEPSSGVLRYASAAHVPALVQRVRDGGTELLPATGPMLGLIEENRFEEAEVRLEPGDGLLLLTDGILEAEDPDGSQYGIERLRLLLSRHIGASPAEILQDMRIDLDSFQREGLPEDDLTALALTWCPRPGAADGPGARTGAEAAGASSDRLR